MIYKQDKVFCALKVWPCKRDLLRDYKKTAENFKALDKLKLNVQTDGRRLAFLELLVGAKKDKCTDNYPINLS